MKQWSGFSNSQIDTVELVTYSDRYNGASVQIVDPESLEEVQTILKEHLGLSNTKNSVDNVSVTN